MFVRLFKPNQKVPIQEWAKTKIKKKGVTSDDENRLAG